MKRLHKHIPKRWDFPGAWYFVTSVTRERQPYFNTDEKCRLFMGACRSVREIHSYRLGGLVILPDHWHALIQPKGACVIETIVGALKQRIFHTGRAAIQNGSMDGPPVRWQPRFMDHRIRDEEDFHRHAAYIRINPYKHGMVPNAQAEWPWHFAHSNPFQR